MENRCTREFIIFHGYAIYRDGTVLGKKGKPLRKEKRERRGGGYDLCVRLYYRGKSKKWTLQRLIAACFLGPIDGYEINHIDRDTTNNHIDNLERLTPSQNQNHWRKDEKMRNKRKRDNQKLQEQSTEQRGDGLCEVVSGQVERRTEV
jgi:hypothetical protein